MNQIQLNHILTLQTLHRYTASKYASDLDVILFEAPELTINGGRARYVYQIVEAGATSFKARAEAIEDGSTVSID